MLHNVNCSDARHSKMPADYDVYAPKKSGTRISFKAQVAALERRFTEGT